MKIFIALVILALTACNSKPKNPDATFAEKLAGDTNSTAVGVGALPVYVDSPKAGTNRKISGKVFCGEGISQYPANQAQIKIMDGKKVIASITTGPTGDYEVSSAFVRNKNYQIEAEAKCGKVSRQFSLMGELSMENLDLYLRR